MINYHLEKSNVVVDALSQKLAFKLKALFAQLSIGDCGSLLDELKINVVLISQIKKVQSTDSKMA